MKTSKFRPFLVIFLLLSFLSLGLMGCGKEEAKATETKEESQKSGETGKAEEKETAATEASSSGKAKKACLITTSPLGNEFTNLIW